MTDQETYLQGKVVFLAAQLSQAVDAMCDMAGQIAVLKAKVAEAEKPANSET